MKFKQAVTTATAVVSNKKTHTSQAKQRNWVKRWESSSLTQQTFCEQNKLNIVEWKKPKKNGPSKLINL